MMNGSLQSKQSYLSSILINVTEYSKLFILKLMSLFFVVINDEHQVGLYSICLVIVGMLYVTPNIYSKILANMPYLLTKKNGSDEINRRVATATRISIICMIPIVLLIIFYGKTLLGHFGSAYIAAYPLLLLITIDGISYTLTSYSMSAILLSGHSRKYLSISLHTVIAYVILAPTLTYFFQMYGIAIAVDIVWLYQGLACYYYLRKHTALKGLGFI